MYNPLTIKKTRPDVINLMDDFFNLGESIFSQPALSKWNNISKNPIEISEDKDYVYVHADLPGVDKKDIQLDLNNGILTIEAKREEKKESKEKDITYSEFSYGKTKRSINVGQVSHTKTNAEFKDGVLSITLPKAHTEQSNKININ